MSSIDTENSIQNPTQDDKWDEVVYSDRGGAEVLALPRWWVEDQLSLRNALSSGTWGEAKAALDPDTYQDLLDRWDTEVHDPPIEPDPEEPIDANEISGYRDGDYPPWPAQYMLDWIPDE